MVVSDLSDSEYVLRCFFEDENIRLHIVDKMKEEYFDDKGDKQLVSLINMFAKKYKRYPSAQELITGLNQNAGYGEDAKAKLLRITKDIGHIDPEYRKTLIENYFQFTISQNMMEEYALSMHDKNPENMRAIMPKMREALNFRLNVDMGLHYIRDVSIAKRALGDMTKSIPSCIGEIRKYTSETPDAKDTCGGYFRKCLSVVGGTSGGGKSMFMVNEAAYAAVMGYNVVYISLELDAAKIWERVTSAIIDVSRYEIMEMSDDAITVKLENAHDNSIPHPGNLFIKWMATRKTTPCDIESYLNELEQAENIKVDLLVVDYIGIMSPDHGTVPANAGSYDRILYSAEQLRNIAVNRDMAALTGTQLQRSGYRIKDVGLDNTSESMGLPNTSDLYICIVHDVAMKKAGYLCYTISKNRFGSSDVNFYTKVNWAHMRISDIDEDDMQIINQITMEQETKSAMNMPGQYPARPQQPKAGNQDISSIQDKKPGHPINIAKLY
jgi:hypothetical protein